MLYCMGVPVTYKSSTRFMYAEHIAVTDEEIRGDTTHVFTVQVGERDAAVHYTVRVDDNYWGAIATEGDMYQLVREAFRFLLARESKEEILREFNLRDISQYFPEFEAQMQERL